MCSFLGASPVHKEKIDWLLWKDPESSMKFLTQFDQTLRCSRCEGQSHCSDPRKPVQGPKGLASPGASLNSRFPLPTPHPLGHPKVNSRTLSTTLKREGSGVNQVSLLEDFLGTFRSKDPWWTSIRTAPGKTKKRGRKLWQPATWVELISRGCKIPSSYLGCFG